MVVIRLARGGTTKKPFYRIVVADQRMPRDGRFIEQLGFFDPRLDKNPTKIQFERVDHWLKNGAQISERVAKLVADAKSAQPAV
jgi:small subunit ribosomal protein S16